ncbi:MAG: bacterial transcriptional activator domain-containing protein [Chloroflexi bacterium]|nr:bacterial transcriptional activator domain-containing protein [Chloroflexota bacterium]
MGLAQSNVPECWRRSAWLQQSRVRERPTYLGMIVDKGAHRSYGPGGACPTDDGVGYAWLEQPGEDGLTLRERYEERVAKLMHDLACRYRDSGDVERAISLFRRLLEAQPTLQPAARGLYRCYALAKNQEALALEHARLVEALHRERQAAGADLADSYTLSPKTLAAYQQAKADIRRTAEKHVA